MLSIMLWNFNIVNMYYYGDDITHLSQAHEITLQSMARSSLEGIIAKNLAPLVIY